MEQGSCNQTLTSTPSTIQTKAAVRPSHSNQREPLTLEFRVCFDQAVSVKTILPLPKRPNHHDEEEEALLPVPVSHPHVNLRPAILPLKLLYKIVVLQRDKSV